MVSRDLGTLTGTGFVLAMMIASSRSRMIRLAVVIVATDTERLRLNTIN